jgi:predicted nucleotidyltransferase
MEKFIQKICRGVVKKYKPDENVLGILLFGSAARNKFDQYSDVDIFILLNAKGKFSRSNFINNKVRVDIIFNTTKEAKNYLKEDRNNVKRNTSHMLAYGKILFQRSNDLGKIQRIAKDNLRLKTKYKNSEILMHKYSIDDFWGEVQRDFANNNYVAFELNSCLLIKNIIVLLLKIKGDFLRRSSETVDIINKNDKKLGNDIKKFYKTKNLKNKLIILSKIINHIYRLSNGPLPQKWQIK